MKFVYKMREFLPGQVCVLGVLVGILMLAGCTMAPRGARAHVASGVSPVSVAASVPVGPYDVFRGPNYTSSVVLTYDDCPNSRRQLIATVQAAQVADIGLVLAPTGACLDSMGADIVDIMRQHGQYVINHSVSHADLSLLSEGDIVRELGAPGVVTNYGRPPFGSGHEMPAVVAAYEAVGMKPWLWTVDTNDWQGLAAPDIVSYVTTEAGEGDTVLMHMQHQAFSPEAVLSIQQGLRARGLEVCRAYPGTTPQDLPDSLPC